MKFALACFTLFSITFHSIAADKMDLSEIKTLSDSGRDLEVLRSAEKVQPSDRGEEWETIVTKSAKNFITKVDKQADARSAFELSKMLIENNPHLKKDAEFMFLVGKAGSQGFSSKAVATPYLVVGLSQDDKRCSDAIVKDAVSDAFTREGFVNEKESARKIAFELCSKQLNDDWVKAMTANDTGLKASCGNLLKTDKLSGVRLTKCQRLAK